MHAQRKNADPFRASALITPERISKSADEAFAPESLPAWAKNITLVTEGGDGGAVIVLGRKTRKRDNRSHIQVGLFELAAIAELTRFGRVQVTANADGTGERVYARMCFTDIRNKLIQIRRILANAGPGETARAVWQEHDVNPEHTSVEPGGHSYERARDVALRYAERAALRANATEEEIAAWLANVDRLFAEIDGLTVDSILAGVRERGEREREAAAQTNNAAA